MKSNRHAGKKRFLGGFRREKCSASRHQHIFWGGKQVLSHWRVVWSTLRAACWVKAHSTRSGAGVRTRPCNGAGSRRETLVWMEGVP